MKIGRIKFKRRRIVNPDGETLEEFKIKRMERMIEFLELATKYRMEGFRREALILIAKQLGCADEASKFLGIK